MGNLDAEVGDMVAILFLTADPSDATRLRIGQEIREIQEKLQLAKLRNKFVLHQRMSVRPADISQALLDIKPRIVHFSGHGTAAGELCFENEAGSSQIVQPEALAALFELVSDQVECVLLNACYSEVQAKAIANHIKYVIGMNTAIGDGAAISFSVGFYQALGAGRSVEEAYRFGCVQIRLQNIPEHLTPILRKK
ncbi:MAG: CHAT domain-containing protein [Acidobacteria bacterium]|nr:CHAT domain-containing protein [Acidobacteriota bacterium]